MTLSADIWLSDAPIRRRYEKSAAGLIAIAQSLAEHRPLQDREDEFLTLYDAVEAADPRIFTAVWNAPAAHAWVRQTYGALGALLSGRQLASRMDSDEDASPEAADLLAQLDAFKAFALAVTMLAGEAIDFDRPFRARLPLAIPGTPWILAGDGHAEVLGYGDDTVRLRVGDATVRLGPGCGESTAGAAVRLRTVPKVTYGGCDIDLNPFALSSIQEPFPQARTAIEMGLDYQSRHAALVEEALRIVQRYAPETFRQIRDFIGCIGLKPAVSHDGFANVSISDLPGAFIAIVPPNPFELADTFVHEFHHFRLFCIEEDADLLHADPPENGEGKRHYSPWRDDPRPLRGLFHGAYVFLPVARFWFAVWQGGGEQPQMRDFALDRTIRNTVRIAVALEILAADTRLTDSGRALRAAIAEGLDSLRREMTSAGMPHDASAWRCMADGGFDREPDEASGRPLSIRESLRDHIERFDRRRECAALDIQV